MEDVRAPYAAATTPGITILADMNEWHLKNQPYGNWSVQATWRNLDRNSIVELTVPLTIDAAGKATAPLPAAFLDAVFADAATRWQTAQDQSTWFHRPGLYLNFISDDPGYRYYDFGGELPRGWNFAGSLNDLVTQLGLAWWPSLPPLTNVGVMVDLGNPLSRRPAPVLATPTPAATPTPGCGGVQYNSACWYLGAAGQSCDQVCATHGLANAAATIAVGSGAANFAVCSAVLDAVAAPALPSSGDVTCGSGGGCLFSTGGAGRMHCTAPATTTGASFGVWRRACACNQ